MTLDEYQKETERTARRADYGPEQRLNNFGLGLAGEAGEVADLLKEHLHRGQPLDRDKLCRELGDVIWYLAATASTAGFTLSEVAVEAEHDVLPEFDVEQQLNYFGFDLAGKAGMVCDLLKKHLHHGQSLDRDKLCLKLGDVLGCVAAIASTAGLLFDEVMIVNVAKLRSRYPDGFDAARSTVRDGEAR